MLRGLIILFACFCIFTSQYSTVAHADFVDVSIPKELNGENKIFSRMERVVFVPIKSKKAFNDSNIKYSRELSYYFFKKGFVKSPVSHALFDTGEVVTLQNDWYANYFDNSFKKGVVMIFLVYDTEFKLEKFENGISLWKNQIFKEVVPYTAIRSLDSVSLQTFEIEPLVLPKVKFSLYQPAVNIQSYFADIDFTKKEPFTLSLIKSDIPSSVKPNDVFKASLTVKNNSKFGLIAGGGNYLQLKSNEDSSFYVKNKWVNTKTPYILKQALIKSTEELALDIDLKGPLMPGKHSENFVLQNKDGDFFTTTIEVTVEDTGQKVLKIKLPTYDALSIRQEPSTSSPEIGKTGEGQLHLFVDQKNGFYKIIFGDKEGWVESRHTQVLKK